MFFLMKKVAMTLPTELKFVFDHNRNSVNYASINTVKTYLSI